MPQFRSLSTSEQLAEHLREKVLRGGFQWIRQIMRWVNKVARGVNERSQILFPARFVDGGSISPARPRDTRAPRT